MAQRKIVDHLRNTVLIVISPIQKQIGLHVYCKEKTQHRLSIIFANLSSRECKNCWLLNSSEKDDLNFICLVELVPWIFKR